MYALQFQLVIYLYHTLSYCRLLDLKSKGFILQCWMFYYSQKSLVLMGNFFFEFVVFIWLQNKIFYLFLNISLTGWDRQLQSCKWKKTQTNTFMQWMLWFIYQTTLNQDSVYVSELKAVKLWVNWDGSHILLRWIKYTS